ncbi:MAG: DnaA regulatory inactivator Hda [Pseudomonadota bacterium]
MSQMTLPIIHIPDYYFDNFISDKNTLVTTFLMEKISAVSSKNDALYTAYLYSKDAVGKTHLLHACCRFAEHLKLPCIYLDSRYLMQMPTEILGDIEDNAVICVDNLQAFANDEQWQITLFDLINKLRETGGKLIVFAANKKPDSLKLQLPDLVSRLNWGTRFKLKTYSDDDKMEILTEHARERGFKLPSHCARHLLKTRNRDLHQLLSIIEIIDGYSLQEKQSITLPFLKKVLDSPSDE